MKKYKPKNTAMKARPTSYGGHLEAAVCYLAYIFFLLLPLLAEPGKLWGGYDMGHHYPFKFYWIESLKEWDPAWWNPYHMLGMPFAAHPLVGAFSPFNVIHLLFRPTLAFTINDFAHFFIAAFGVYYLLRSLGSGWGGGFLAGMAYAFCAFFMSHGLQGQAPLWWAASWLPWTLFFLIPALEEKKFFPLMWTSACLCLCLWEGYPQIVYYTLLVVGFYLLRVLWLRPGEWKDVFLAGFLLLGGMIALGACQIFPSSEFIPRSNRWGWGYSDIMTDYLTPDRLKHFWTPDFLGNPFNISYVGKWGYHEIVNYIGLIPLVFFGAGLLAWGRIRLYGWFFTIALLFTTLSLGDSTWVSRTLFRGFYYLVPGFSHNRSIGRMMVITCFAMACAAGLVFDAWVRWEKAIRARKPETGQGGWLRSFFKPTTLIPALLIILTVADIWTFGRRFIELAPAANCDGKEQILPLPVVEEALRDPDRPRIAQINSVNANLFYKARGIFSTDRTDLSETENLLIRLQANYDTPLSDILRLKYLWAPALKESARWQTMGSGVFRNTKTVPPVFLAGGYEVVAGDEKAAFDRIAEGKVDLQSSLLLNRIPEGLVSQPGPAGESKITGYGNNRISVECNAARPCLLFLSEQFYPGWKALVDGNSVPVLKADGIFRAVPIGSAGVHHVEMIYRPWRAYWGLAISALSWLMLFLGGRKWKNLRFDGNLWGRLRSNGRGSSAGS